MMQAIRSTRKGGYVNYVGVLSPKGAPRGTDPAVGDLSYYSPWGNPAFHYKDFGYSKGLVKLGRVTVLPA